jgi:hypothetical protein
MKNKNNKNITLLLGVAFIGVLWIGMMSLFYFENRKNISYDLEQNKNNEIKQPAEKNTLQKYYLVKKQQL